MKLRDKALLFGAITLSAVLIAAAFFWRIESRKAANPPPVPAAGEPGEQAPSPETPALSRTPVESSQVNQREVTLFFQAPGGGDLQGEKRKIFLTETVTDQARQTVKELIEGPRTELVPTFPPTAEVREVYLSKDGTAYVDFSKKFVDDHPGGSSAELDTVFSLVDTLAFNFPEIKRVKILVEGEERATLKEHLDLTRPYVADMSIVAQPRGR
jgi:spore germination protein GerM